MHFTLSIKWKMNHVIGLLLGNPVMAPLRLLALSADATRDVCKKWINQSRQNLTQIVYEFFKALEFAVIRDSILSKLPVVQFCLNSCRRSGIWNWPGNFFLRQVDFPSWWGFVGPPSFKGFYCVRIWKNGGSAAGAASPKEKEEFLIFAVLKEFGIRGYD